jgi:hypothetical protein
MVINSKATADHHSQFTSQSVFGNSRVNHMYVKPTSITFFYMVYKTRGKCDSEFQGSQAFFEASAYPQSYIFTLHHSLLAVFGLVLGVSSGDQAETGNMSMVRHSLCRPLFFIDIHHSGTGTLYGDLHSPLNLTFPFTPSSKNF